MPGPTGDDDPPLFVGALRFRGPGVHGWAGTNELEIDGVGPTEIGISAGTTSTVSSAFTFSNANNVSFGIDTSGVVTASASHDGIRTVALFTQGVAQALSVTNATDSTLIGSAAHLPLQGTGTSAAGLSLGNVMFRISSNSILAVAYQNYLAPSGTNRAAQQLSFSNANGVLFGLSSTLSALFGIIPILTASFSTLSFSNANNVSFGIVGSTLTASATVASTADPQIGLVSHIGGNSVSSVTRLAFSNASNVTFSLSTAANAATLLASVAAGGAGGIAASAAGSSQSAGTVVWSNSNNVSFGMNGSTVTASVTVASTQGSIRITAGTANNLLSQLSFSNANGFSFGLNGSTITGSNNITNFRISAGTEAALGSQISFANGNGVTFGLNVSTITASVGELLGLVSHVGGNSVADVTRLAFSNASNVTFSLSTAAGAATLLASVNAGGAGGVAIADIYGNTRSSGTVLFDANNPNSTISNLFSLNSRSGNVAFGLTNGSVITAQAHLAFFDATNGDGSVATRLNFVSGGNVTFNAFTGSDTAGARQMNVSANVATGNPALSFYRNVARVSGENNSLGVGTFAAGMWVNPFAGGEPFQAEMTANQFDLLWGFGPASVSNSSLAFTLRGGVYTRVNSTQLSLVNSFSLAVSSQSVTASSLTASRASAFQAARWVQLSSSNWSSSPVFSQGVQYWMASRLSTAGQSWMSLAIGQLAQGFVGLNYRGTFGVATGADLSSRILPMAGVITNTSPPTTIGSANFIASEANQSGWIPCFQFRDGVFQ